MLVQRRREADVMSGASEDVLVDHVPNLCWQDHERHDCGTE